MISASTVYAEHNFCIYDISASTVESTVDAKQDFCIYGRIYGRCKTSILHLR